MKFTLKPNNKARVFDQTYPDIESVDDLQPKIEADLRATLGLF